ncbi:hypothetical protein HNQ57_002609 [Zhongshania antarctica]|uniref:Uncharacterized protein n=1 Tax=Zhongshania antarctica TaxID=641702 RepID=A0A840R7H5_9GAMM|nr:hypothetical protein [Zhongshania antarctica]
MQPSETIAAIFNAAKNERSCCASFYCTTCGGLGTRLQKITADHPVEIPIAALKSIHTFPLTQRDFVYHQHISKSAFPKEPNISPFIEYLRWLLNCMPIQNKVEISEEWRQLAPSLPIWLLDGICYYFVPLLPSSELQPWKTLLSNRITETSDASLSETLRLKY